ncbi:MAG: tetratricopeptide repeat protein, partial [Xenococcus sp. (in: cyanobacteria)]
MNISVLSFIVLLLVLSGCQSSSIDADNDSEISNVSQDNDITIFGVSPDVYAEAEKQAQEAQQKLEKLRRDRSLNATAKRVLAEADEAREQGDNQRYLEKIQEYRQILNDEPIKRAAEAWVLEGRVLFSQLKVKEAQNAIEEAIKLDSTNPKYVLTLAVYLRWNGKYQRMIEVSEEAISLIENQESENKILLAASLSILGKAHLYGGNYDLASNTLQQSLELFKKLLGEEHSFVAVSLNNLALLYYEQGRYEEAEPLFLQALGLYKKVLGEEYPDVGTSLNNLALLYKEQGRYEEAEPLFLQSLELRKKLLGEEHPNVAISLGNLAGLYSN